MYRFRPILKSLLWGGEKIAPYKEIAADLTCIGESWELSGVEGNVSVVAEGPDAGLTLAQLIARDGARLLGKKNSERFGDEFPLLVKFIDARQDLSIQVHPDDKLAWERHRSKGKTEMWYVVAADEGAHLRSGFAKEVTPAQYEASVADGTITGLLADYAVRPGDVFFLPAGRVHSIGAGSFIAEIQQTSDITYRIYDFNRRDAQGNKRELHTEQAKDAIDYTVLPDYRTRYEAAQNLPLLHHDALRPHRAAADRSDGDRFVRGRDLHGGTRHRHRQRRHDPRRPPGRDPAGSRFDGRADLHARKRYEAADQPHRLKPGQVIRSCRPVRLKYAVPLPRTARGKRHRTPRGRPHHRSDGSQNESRPFKGRLHSYKQEVTIVFESLSAATRPLTGQICGHRKNCDPRSSRSRPDTAQGHRSEHTHALIPRTAYCGISTRR